MPRCSQRSSAVHLPMSKSRILVQLDSDAHASVFDAVVAVDAGVEHLLQYSQVEPDKVRDLVHGAMFTRGPDDLKSTAIFIGGADVTRGERLLGEVTRCFFGPMRVSVMQDANGANTTAAAAVLSVADHVALDGATALVLGGTGPVGQRAARLLAARGAQVRVASRQLSRAEQVCQELARRDLKAQLTPVATANAEDTERALDGVAIVIAAGAAGVRLLPSSCWQRAEALRVLVDLNAVPPLGIEEIEVTDRAVERHGKTCYGAIGVGGLKMKIHKAALQQLFTANDQVLDAEEIYGIGERLKA